MQNLLRSHAIITHRRHAAALALARSVGAARLATSRIGRMQRTVQPTINQLQRRGAT
jgi:hypothetical protein